MTAITDFLPGSLVEAGPELAPGREHMAPTPHKLAFIFATVLVMAAFLAITTWAAAAPKPQSDSAAPIAGKATIHRPDLWKVYYFLTPAR